METCYPVFRIRSINAGVVIVDIDSIIETNVIECGTAVLNLRDNTSFIHVNSGFIVDEKNYENIIKEEVRCILEGLRETLGFQYQYTAD